LSRGTQVAEAIDLLAEIHNIKAPTQPSGYGSFEPGSSGPGSPEWGEHVLPERECKGCGIVFQPMRIDQTYHTRRCGNNATNRTRSELTRQSHLAYVAAEKAKAEGDGEDDTAPLLSERECKGCGVTFRPRFGVQTYHDVPCRTAATVRRRLEHTVRWQGRR